jgi:Cu(I)/Ag(I) efflux system membrane fusion protein
MKSMRITLALATGVGIAVVAYLAGRHSAQPPSYEANAPRILYYRDPMHPSYHADKPGTAPDCGMRLEPVYSGNEGLVSSQSAGLSNTFHISPERQRLIGVQVTEARRQPTTHVLRMPGRVAADETRVYRVTGKVEGWVREIFSPTTGSVVKKGQLLVSVYGRDYRMAQQSYAFALNAADRAKEGGGTFDAVEQNRLPVAETLAILNGMGVDPAQIEEIGRTRQPQLDTRLTAPAGGIILARNVYPNQKFEAGAELYRIADISHVWVVADLYSNEAQYVRPGAAIRFSLSAYPQKTFTARVSDVPPQFDGVSRTLKLRMEVENPGFALRPDMIVDVEAPVTLPAAVTVPADAVIDSGLNRTVFIEHGDGYFEPREVETGWRYDNRIEILKGLEGGERVVSGATFLVDSESRLQASARRTDQAGPIDPSCGMAVDAAHAFKAEYEGKTYYFCSESCRKKWNGSRQGS